MTSLLLGLTWYIINKRLVTSYPRQVRFRMHGHDFSAKTAHLGGDARKKATDGKETGVKWPPMNFDQQTRPATARTMGGPMVERSRVLVDSFGLLNIAILMI